MLFCRAEKEADWPLHLRAVSLMIPSFFAAGHHNYFRYGSYYLRSSDKICRRFLLVTRHLPGTWNGIWTYMMIETTFMKYGKGPRGRISITLKTQCNENLGNESSHLLPYTEGHWRYDQAREVDWNPSQGGNKVTYVIRCIGKNSGTSL